MGIGVGGNYSNKRDKGYAGKSCRKDNDIETKKQDGAEKTSSL